MTAIRNPILDTLCPMHAMLDASGRIVQSGPTLRKLGFGLDPGAAFLHELDIYRPRQIANMDDLRGVAGRRLHLRHDGDHGVQFRGVFVPDESGGGVIDLSFNIYIVDAVRLFDLSGSDFSPTDLSIELLYLVEANAAAMEASKRLNARLQTAMLAAEERALTDILTGLGNRRAMELTLAKLERAGRDYTVMHIDLDYFKSVNDTLGHAAGDTVLRNVARNMQAEVRKSDMVARMGGDEFIIIFPDLMSERRLEELANRIIARIESPLHGIDPACRVSASIGVARSRGATRESERVLSEADSALYAAKNAGRRQFRIFDADQGAPACKAANRLDEN